MDPKELDPYLESRKKFMELADQLEKEDSAKYHDMIINLRNLEYDDFANERFATPKIQMVADFRALGREDIAQRVMNGDFDQ